MAFSRYGFDGLSADGRGLKVSTAFSDLRAAIKSGEVSITRSLLITQADRLDHLAGALYGDSRYWWVLAAASNIGWGLQVPPGTVISVPDLQQVERSIT